MRCSIALAVLAFPALALSSAAVKYSAPFRLPATVSRPLQMPSVERTIALRLHALPGGDLCLAWHGSGVPARLRLYCPRGRVVGEAELTGGRGSVSLALLSAGVRPAGVYYAVLATATRTFTIPVAVAR